MQRDARLCDALSQLLKTVLDRKILSVSQLVSMSYKGLWNSGTNSCYINAYLLFMFETIRCVPELKEVWEDYVKKVLRTCNQSWFINAVCSAYHTVYVERQTANDMIQCKDLIDRRMRNPDGLGDCFDFGRFLAKRFQKANERSQHLIHLDVLWRNVFNADLFLIQGCDSAEKFFSLQYVNPSAQAYNATSLHGIRYVPGHYIFYKRLGSGWLEFNDSTVSYLKHLPTSQPFTIVLYKRNS